MSWPRAVLFGTCLSAILTSTAACQSSAEPAAVPTTAEVTTPSTAPTTRPDPTPSAPATTPRVARPLAASRPASPRRRPSPTPRPPLCAVPAGVTARQVVLVDAWGSGATIRACARNGSRYRLALAAGCVSLPTSGLLAVMRWERSGAVMAVTG